MIDAYISLSGDANNREMQYIENLKNYNLLVLKYENTIEN